MLGIPFPTCSLMWLRLERFALRHSRQIKTTHTVTANSKPSALWVCGCLINGYALGFSLTSRLLAGVGGLLCGTGITIGSHSISMLQIAAGLSRTPALRSTLPPFPPFSPLTCLALPVGFDFLVDGAVGTIPVTRHSHNAFVDS